MLWAILVSLLVLGLAFLLKDFVEVIVESMNSFFVIIGIFIILYIGATIFVVYSTKAYSAEKILPDSQGDAYARQDSIKEIDLSTGL